MGSVKSSVKVWKTAGTLLAVLIFLRGLGPGAGWPQESAQPQIDEEFTKQEKIYRSLGADVPSGYVTGRALSDYAALLPSGFCGALGRLGNSDRWLDIGAGEGQALLDYYSLDEDTAPAANCVRSVSRARVVAMSIEDRRTDKWRQQAAIFGDRIRYLSGKRLRNYSGEELGKFQIITDVFGGFSYSEDLSQFVDTVLNLLEVGGVFYTVVQSVHLEDGKDKPSTWYLTELVDAAGDQEKVCSWLKKTACVKVSCESKSDWDTPTELINIRKICSNVSVPRMKLLKFEAGNPPGRRFQLEP
jgi:SAM-dependent methyltransferase